MNLYLALMTQMNRKPLLCSLGTGRFMMSLSVSWLYPKDTPTRKISVSALRNMGGNTHRACIHNNVKPSCTGGQ